jgi:hypothetical protein
VIGENTIKVYFQNRIPTEFRFLHVVLIEHPHATRAPWILLRCHPAKHRVNQDVSVFTGRSMRTIRFHVPPIKRLRFDGITGFTRFNPVQLNFVNHFVVRFVVSAHV